MNKNIIYKLSAVILSLFLAACNSGGGDEDDPEPFEEVYEQGVDRYLGSYTPMSTSSVGSAVAHTFGAGDGPLCLDGSEYTMSTRDLGSSELVIFLEGGGACWSTFCAANETASAGVPGNGVLDESLAGNPLAEMNVAYFPYCDGSLFTGDVDNEYDIRAGTEYQRGLKNLSAGLDVVASTFPAPERIVLAGNSGGALGSIFALSLVRKLYPSVPIDVINDSGLGIGKDGDPDFQNMLFDEWNSTAFLPDSGCPECLANGHLTEYFRWQMEEDDNFRLAMLTSKQDFIIGTAFLQVGGPAFEVSALRELAAIEAFSDGRMHSWVVDGANHTFVQRDVTATAGGVSVLDWLTDFLNGDDDWSSVSD